MWISQLDLTQWRNHLSSRIRFEQGVTLFLGPNGQGKTNILEAIQYLATLGSHRVASVPPLIGDTHDGATVYAALHHGERDVHVGLSLKRQGSNEATLNGAKAKVSEIPRWVSAVLFAPEDAAIVRGEPSFRRHFMDDLVLASSPSMAAVFGDFDRVLKQRNTLLKSLRGAPKTADLSTLDTWTESYVDVASKIISDRCRYLQDLTPLVAAEYASLAGGQQVATRYVPRGYGFEDVSKSAVEQALRQALESVRGEEIERGMTLVGPHRDDVDLTIENKPARTHASQGETWSLALALRLGLAQWIRTTRSSGDPIMMLDDVFAELDATRRRKLVAALGDYEQLIITSAVEEDLPQGLDGSRWDVREGTVSVR